MKTSQTILISLLVLGVVSVIISMNVNSTSPKTRISAGTASHNIPSDDDDDDDDIIEDVKDDDENEDEDEPEDEDESPPKPKKSKRKKPKKTKKEKAKSKPKKAKTKQPKGEKCPKSKCRCGESKRCFLGKCFWKPGNGKKNKKSVKKWVPDCERYEDQDFLTSDPNCDIKAADGLPACQWLCRYTQAGIVSISKEQWKTAQKGESDLWVMNGEWGATVDRSDEMEDGFEGYEKVPLDLGDVIEVGCGPFTQLHSLFTFNDSGRKAKSVTLLEPGIDRYVKDVKTCRYKDGTLDGYKVKLISKGGEEMRFENKFDTLVMMNVVEHVQDGFELLERAYRAIKVGGIIVFHDRHYNQWWSKLNPKTMTEEVAGLHPIRIRKPVYDHFLSKFETIFLSMKPNEAMKKRNAKHNLGLKEEPIWFVGRKTENSRCCEK